MDARVGGRGAGVRSSGKGALLAGVSAAALTLACWLPSAALAGNYTAGTLTEFQSVLALANADPDPSATITLTNNVNLGGFFQTATKPITVNTQGFTIGGGNYQGNSFTLFGNVFNATGAGFNTGGGGLLTNNATVVNAPGTVAGLVGTGATLVNNGSITGVVRITTAGGTIINNGFIQAGSSASTTITTQIAGGAPAVVTNNSTGTIRGGTSGGAAIQTAGGLTHTITNFGLIEGGFGAVAIQANANNTTVINGGTIRGGSANAIVFSTSAAARATLELQDGSQIFGNVIASVLGTNDTLRLTGIGSNSLDISQYQNFDTFQKTGAGTWTLTGTGVGATPWSVQQGTLLVNGSTLGPVDVLTSATLGGNGAVGATTLLAGGRIAPGNSMGTLTINGAYVQNAGSTYQVELDPATMASDRIQVNGTATLASGAAISVSNYTGAPFVAGQRFTILTSTGLTGTYGLGDQVLTPFLNLRDAYDANNAYLTVVQTRTVGSIGTTPNQIEVGNSVDSLPAGNPVQTGLINQGSVDGARNALDQMSGEIHASAKTALIDESWLLRAALNDRLRAAFGAVGAQPMATMNYGFTADLAPSVKGPMPTLKPADRFSVWGQGYGSWGRTESDGNASKLTRSSGGLLLGTDVAVFDNLRFGVLAGYSRSEFDVNARLSSGESDNYHLGLYGGGQFGALSLRTGASYTWHEVETRRAVISAALGSSLRADYDAGTAQVFGELGYRVDLGRVALEPFAGLAYVNLRTNGFGETGGPVALTGESDDTSLGYSTLGLRASTSLDLQGMGLTLRGGLAWRHAFGDVDPATTLAFAGSSAFTIAGMPIARDAALVEAGLDLAISQSATLGVSYTSQLAEDAQDHAFKGVLAVRF